MSNPIRIPGLIRGESNSDYHRNEAISSSDLKKFCQRPTLLKKHMDGLIRSDETEAMKTGSATHTLVLEPDTFESRYEVLPDDFNARTNDGRGMIARIEAEGKIPLNHDAYRDLVELRESVMRNRIARALLAQGEAELTWRLKGDHYSMQCRSDWFCLSAPSFQGMSENDFLLPEEGEPYVLDLKTTQCLDDWVSDGWNNVIFKFGYDRQCVFYQLVMNVILRAAGYPTVTKFIFVVVEKHEPRECAVFVLDSSTVESAMAGVREDLQRLAECLRTGVWPGFSDDVIETGISDRVRDTRALDAINSRRLLA